MKQPINLLSEPQSEESTSNEKGQAFLISGIIHLILLVIVLFGPSLLSQSQLSEPIKDKYPQLCPPQVVVSKRSNQKLI